MMENCKNITQLSDILLLCDFYNVSRPQQQIFQKIVELPLDISNVIEYLRVAKKIGAVKVYENLSSNLESRCITFVRYNLTYWNILINFVVENTDNIDMVKSIVEHLAQDKMTEIRLIIFTNKIIHNLKY